MVARSPVVTWLLLGGGGLLVYSAIKQRSPFATVASVIGGQQPTNTTQPYQAATLTAATTTLPADAGFTGTSATGAGAAAVAFARQQLGDPYQFGATGPNKWDCSGLVQAAWAAAGVQLPRTTYQQVNSGTASDVNHIVPGDLIFYKGEDESGNVRDFGHVAMAVGSGMQIVAPHTGAFVRIEPIQVSAVQAVRHIA